MKFLDQAKINISSGKGGDGCISFRREKFVPEGGPDGGNGGNGGSVYIEGKNNLNTLIDYRYQRHFKAGHGESGKGKNRFGKRGKDITLFVPLGTQIFDFETKSLLADITREGQKELILPGGKGGMGNINFKSSTNQAPEQHTKGELGAEAEVILQLKLISDIGLVGLPNAGKSSLISVATNARPKIADYPFTTLVPNLGVVEIDYIGFVIADIPGLIDGASEGKGLGDRFLRHIERCKAILHLIDITSKDVIEDYQVIRHELASYKSLYDVNLCDKKELVVLTKIDLVDEEYISEIIANVIKELKIDKSNIICISSATIQNITEIKRKMLAIVQAEKDS